jgi:hypothetical protein
VSGRRAGLVWGLVLIGLGVAMLLRNAGVWPDRLSLWPVVLLGVGLALLIGELAGGRRADLLLPLALVGLGAVFVISDLVPGLPAAPLVLLALGAALLLAGLRRSAPGDDQRAVRVPLDGATQARVVVDHGAGTLTMTGGAGAGLLCEGVVSSGVEEQLRRDGDGVHLKLRQADPWRFVGVGWRRPQDWQLRLPAGVRLGLELRSGANRSTIDLRGLDVDDVRISTGASETDLTVPEAGTCRVRVEAGAANVRVAVPEGVAAEVRARTGLASLTVDEGRFPRSGDWYRSAGFESAAARVTIDLEGGVASFSVR